MSLQLRSFVIDAEASMLRDDNGREATG